MRVRHGELLRQGPAKDMASLEGGQGVRQQEDGVALVAGSRGSMQIPHEKFERVMLSIQAMKVEFYGSV